MKRVQIKDEYITLGQLLKIVDLVSSGGETKVFLSSNKIFVNNEPENRRGKKLYKDDVIEISGVSYIIC